MTEQKFDEPRALVVGDVHGHFDRLEALLVQEGLLENGKRTEENVEVVQIGDLAHFGNGTTAGDLTCYNAAREGLIDILLWGNHDRAVRYSAHEFMGYSRPSMTINHIIRSLEVEGRMKLAHAAHGYLLTHAGLHQEFESMDVPKGLNRYDPYEVADYINQKPEKFEKLRLSDIVDNISRHRGGGSMWGGILWRDFEEPLYDKFPQIFGHSASPEHEVRMDGESYCIDIGGKGSRKEDNCLAAIWLPDMQVVRVDL